MDNAQSDTVPHGNQKAPTNGDIDQGAQNKDVEMCDVGEASTGSKLTDTGPEPTQGSKRVAGNRHKGHDADIASERPAKRRILRSSKQ